MKPYQFASRLLNTRWRISFIVYCLLLISHCQAQTLSSMAQVDLIIVDSGETLADSFGEAMVQIRDPGEGIYKVYSYALPDVGSVAFYGRLLSGRLTGRLALVDLPQKKQQWKAEHQIVKRYMVQLSTQQIQRLFDALEKNRRPENRDYPYDFLYDNASTRVRDALVKCCADSLILSTTDSILTWRTFRFELSSHSWRHPWTTFGVNLLLGQPTDQPVTPWTSMFLPEGLNRQLAKANIRQADGQVKPLLFLKDFDWDKNRGGFSFLQFLLSPNGLIFLYFGLYAGLRWWERKRGHKIVWPVWIDWLLFSLTGLIGWLLVWAWLGPGRGISAWNPNLLVFIPIYFPMIFWATHMPQSTPGRIIFMTAQAWLLIQIILRPCLFFAFGTHPVFYDLFWLLFLLNSRAKAYSPPLILRKTQPTPA